MKRALLAHRLATQRQPGDHAVVAVVLGRRHAVVARPQGERHLELGGAAEQDDLRPLRAGDVDQRFGVRGHLVQPKRTVEQLAGDYVVVLVQGPQGAEGAVAHLVLLVGPGQDVLQLEVADLLVQRRQGRQGVHAQERLPLYNCSQFLAARRVPLVRQRLRGAEPHQHVGALQAGLEGGGAGVVAQGLQPQGSGHGAGRVEQVAGQALLVGHAAVARNVARRVQRHGQHHAQEVRQVVAVGGRHGQIDAGVIVGDRHLPGRVGAEGAVERLVEPVGDGARQAGARR